MILEKRIISAGMGPGLSFLFILLTCSVAFARDREDPGPTDRIVIFPPSIVLDSGADFQRVIVLQIKADGVTADVTDSAELFILDPTSARIVSDQRVVPVSNGETILRAKIDGFVAEAKISVVSAGEIPAASFQHDVIPILTLSGCNAGGCHGNSAGKAGFRLSLFGFDPAQDHASLTRELRGRRIDPVHPGESLILQKPTALIAHGGGLRFGKDSHQYETLRRWISSGATYDDPDAVKLVGIDVHPPQCVLLGVGETQRFGVRARYSDGRDRDVTHLALLSVTDEGVAAIDADGTVTSASMGESYVLARFGVFAQVAQVLVVADEVDFEWPADVVAFNYVDEKVHDKLKKLRVAPAPLCSDQTFVRRIFLDLLNVLPTRGQTLSFLESKDPKKRENLVSELLRRPEFPDVWAMQWAEVLRVESEKLEKKGMHLFTNYLKDGFFNDVPFDDLVYEMLTAEGGNFTNPASNFYLMERDPKALAENVSQIFLGIRIQCAQCHNHPFERWTQDDYYGFASFFGRVGIKRGEDPREQIIFDQGRGEVRHLRDGRVVPPRFLGGEEPTISDGQDRRVTLAKWLVSEENPYFATNVANRVFARFFGRGIVDPPDDARVSNPPSHPRLFRALGSKLISYNYDLRRLIRDLCLSRTYQQASHSDELPASLFAGASVRRLTAEQMLDGMSQVTGVATKYRGLPLGARASQVADGVPGNAFLDIFGRPRRSSSCTCERRGEPTLSQALHLINGSTLSQKLRSKNSRLRKLLAEKKTPAQIVEDLYLSAYSRRPTDTERARILGFIDKEETAELVLEDVYWAVLNSKEFLFNH